MHYGPRHALIDDLLAQIREMRGELVDLQQEAQAEIDRVTSRYGDRIAGIKSSLQNAERKLQTAVTRHRDEVFNGRDRVDLNNGAVMLAIEARVRRARGVLERLEAIGDTTAIRIAKCVDWDVIDQWTDERLIEIGTDRRRRQVVTYELFEDRTRSRRM